MQRLIGVDFVTKTDNYIINASEFPNMLLESLGPLINNKEPIMDLTPEAT